MKSGKLNAFFLTLYFLLNAIVVFYTLSFAFDLMNAKNTLEFIGGILLLALVVLYVVYLIQKSFKKKDKV